MTLATGFGVTGDGRTDDTAALQHAIDAGGGVLQLAKGTYRLSRSLELDATRLGYVGIRGEQGASRLLMAAAGPAVSITGDHRGTATPAHVQPHTWERERMPIVSGIEIVGAHRLADGIRLTRTMQTTIQNTLLRRVRHGIQLVERNRNFLLSACHIYDCHETGVFFDHCNLHQVIITGNHISYCKRAGIYQHNGDVHNIQITGNDIEYNSGYDGTRDPQHSGEIVLAAPEGIISEYTIAGNTLQATREAAGANLLILGSEETPGTAVRLVAVTGNVLGSRDRNVVITDGVRISITGNTIYDGTRRNVVLTDCHTAVLSGNTIATRPASWESTSRDGIALLRCVGGLVAGNVINDCLHEEGAILVRECRELAIANNQLLDSHDCGIAVRDSVRCRISDNSISETRAEPKMTRSVRVTGSSHHNVIQSNLVSAAIECSDERGRQIANTVLPVVPEN
ncbi:MAG: hypothetical protein CMJ59_17095 [Planctomycetaceae bacterium]|nr:hypothetical protein [Planctomycetaceae bacterium]